MKDGLYFNGNHSNYNFIQDGDWGGWAESNGEDWLEWQGAETSYEGVGWADAAELKIPVEYLT